MSHTEKPLAEKLRAWLEAEDAAEKAGDVAYAARALVPEALRFGSSAEAYLRGYDDAKAECAAEIEENGVLKRRVQELASELAVRMTQPAAVEGKRDA
jgi:hypothetical protein